MDTEAAGAEPEQAHAETIQLGLRLPRALREQLEQVAAKHESSVSGAARYLLRRALADFDKV